VKWPYEKLLSYTDTIYKCYMKDEISKEELDAMIPEALDRAGWTAEEFDEEVASRDNSVGCR